MTLEPCPTNVLDTVACEVVQILINYEVPNFNRPPFVMTGT